MKLPALLPLSLSLLACGPVTPQAAPLLQALRDSPSKDLTLFLEDQVELHTTTGVVTGPQAVARALRALTVEAGAKVESHHDVARLSPASGALLFAASGSDGRVRRVFAFDPAPSSATTGVLATYAESWNQDATTRAPNLATAWATDGRYVDPSFDRQGREGLSAVIDTFRASFPGATLHPGQAQTLPSGAFTFSWTMEVPMSTPLVGFDVGFTGDDGAIHLISGFFTAR
jgi:hypothetical protein